MGVSSSACSAWPSPKLRGPFLFLRVTSPLRLLRSSLTHGSLQRNLSPLSAAGWPIRYPLIRCCARPPFALERLSRINNSEALRYWLPKPLPDGRTALVLTPLELLERLAALIPPLVSDEGACRIWWSSGVREVA